MIGTQLAGRLLGRLGTARTVVASLSVGGAGMIVSAAALSERGSCAALLPGIVLIGLGQGVGWTAMFAAAGTGIGLTHEGVASARASTTQQVGAAVGLAVVLGIAANPDQAVDGLHLAGVMAGLVTEAAVLLVRFLGSLRATTLAGADRGITSLVD